MSTKCFTCKEPIINADYIECEGTCAEKFHSKCVALNKTTLNAITSCPNVHWFCHECNNGIKAIGTSIDNMRNAVEGLTNRPFHKSLYVAEDTEVVYHCWIFRKSYQIKNYYDKVCAKI